MRAHISTDVDKATDRPADVEIVLPARAESVAVARQAVSGLSDALGWNGQFLADVKIVVSEACTNVVLHAYPDGDPGPILLRMWVEPAHLRVRIGDHGSGMNPKLGSAAEGLGLGLPLMAALSDEVKVRSSPDGPTEVDVEFAIPTDDESR